MRVRSRRVMSLVFVALSIFALAPAAGADTEAETELLAKINATRAANGLGALQLDGALRSYARSHAEDMANAGEVYHSSQAELTSAAGAGWSGIAENVGKGPSPTSLHNAFMASPGHKANILGNYNYVGIGTDTRGGSLYVTVVFVGRGNSTAADPIVTGTAPRGTPGAGDEMFFYRNDGLYSFYDVKSNGSLGAKLSSGTGYTKNMSEINAVDLDGDGRDEMMFYRSDGLYAFYDVRPDGRLGAKLNGGTGYTKNFSSIAAVDLDGDNKDELFFYRQDGLFAFYDVRSDGRLGTKLSSGTGYTKNMSEINAVDLDGDGRDEMMFYRSDGLYAFYDVRPDGRLGAKLNGGTGYTKNFSSIAAVDLDGDNKDELFFYRQDGLFAFYRVGTNGVWAPSCPQGLATPKT